MSDSVDTTNADLPFDSRSRAFLKEMERLRNEMDELIRRRADLEQRIREKMAELAESRARLLFLRRIQNMIYSDEPHCFCPRADVFCRCFSNRATHRLESNGQFSSQFRRTVSGLWLEIRRVNEKGFWQ